MCVCEDIVKCLLVVEYTVVRHAWLQMEVFPQVVVSFDEAFAKAFVWLRAQ